MTAVTHAPELLKLNSLESVGPYLFNSMNQVNGQKSAIKGAQTGTSFLARKPVSLLMRAGRTDRA
jgi:hypothetical protein